MSNKHKAWRFADDELLYTNKELADALGINLAKQQRHAREFLGIDPSAGQSSGVERQLTLEQAFIVYLCGVAVNIHKVPLKEAKGLAKDLPFWLFVAKYTPIVKHLENRLDIDIDAQTGEDNSFLHKFPNKEDYLRWELLISKSSVGYMTIAKGLLYLKIDIIDDEDLDDRGLTDGQRITDVFLESHVSMHGRSDGSFGEPIYTARIRLDRIFLDFTKKLGLWTYEKI